MRLGVLTSHPIQYYAPLFRHLATRLDLHVFFAHRTTSQEQANAGFGVAFHWDVDLDSGYEHTFLKNVSAAPGESRFLGYDTPEVGSHLRDGNFDVVLSLGWHLKSLVQGIWAAKRLGLPVMVRGDSQLSTERTLAKRAIKKVAYPALLQVFDAALYVGARNKQYYEHYGYPLERLFHSPHCVETQRFASSVHLDTRGDLRAKLGVDDSTKLVLFAGKLVPFKRPLDVVDAAAALRGQAMDVQVMMAGSGELETEVRKHAAERSVPIHLLGFQNQSQMPAVYAAADVLVLPSDARETWGLVCNEALACGTPVVVSDAAGCAPDLADGAGGRMFPCGDLQACASALEELITRPPTRAEIAALSDRFSIEAAAAGVLDAAEHVVRNRSR